MVKIPFDITIQIHSKEQLKNGNPLQMNCVIALRKVLYDTLDIRLPPCYVWNLPNLLVHSYKYNKITTDNIQNGDILLLRKLSKDRISHVVLGLDQNEVFHSCRSKNTVIELFDCLNEEYSTVH
ncbi:MAG: NlpC/P60 family protein [candidate division SR1 bacterium]|nr:NlpC/P60 family protein [candidate division SR1 bacterium]